jgi:hypothetical protein
MSGERREALLEALGAYRVESPHDDQAISRFRAFLERDVRFLLTTEDGGALAPGAAWFPFDTVSRVDRDGSLTRAVAKARARLA